MGKYDDIINFRHYRSPYRTPMPIENRAAQFAPFAALSGHDEAISEISRLTSTKIELTDEEKIEISKIIKEAHYNGHIVTITYFIPDNTKSGGGYTTTTGRISKVDKLGRQLILEKGFVILMDHIYSISIEQE